MSSGVVAIGLYVILAGLGSVGAWAIGLAVEARSSQGVSLIVFLALFFGNLAASWIAVILVMDGSLKEAQGRQSQLDIEKSGRAAVAARAPGR